MYESRPFIGGKVASWQKDGNHVEMGLHVVRRPAAALGACVPASAVEADQGPAGSACLRVELVGIAWGEHAGLCLLQCLLWGVAWDGRLQVW